MNNKTLEKNIGYAFKNKELLNTALTHSSYNMDRGNKHCDNERLEFLGDAFLDSIISVELYHRMPKVSEGKLTKTRAVLVCEKSLANIAKVLELGKYMNMGYGEEIAGGRSKDSILADAVEALIGAVFMDGGYEATKKVILRAFDSVIQIAIDGKMYVDYKSELQEFLQCKGKVVNINYTTDKEEGPAHDKTFHVHVDCDGKIYGKGIGKSKKEAEKNAAKNALNIFRKGEA